MKALFVLFAVAAAPYFHSSPSDPWLDPTGTYLLKGIVERNRIMGHSGELRVKLLDPSHIAFCFYINRGYPGYESGAFLDTLLYHDNLASYTPARDRDCRIIFCFGYKSVEVRQTYSDPHSGCGFAKGIMASAFFRKRSAENPIIQDLSGHGMPSS
jgi:hypothetical protein